MATHLTQSEHKLQMRFGWREWALLTIMGTLAALTAIPALWARFQQVAQALGIPLLALLLNQVLQSVFQLGLVVAIGLFFAHRVGLGAPIIENKLAGQKVGMQLRSILNPTIIPVVGLAIAVIVLDRLIFRPLLPGFSTVITQVGGWRGLLVSFYGGIVEELLMRLFVLSVAAWLLGRISYTPARLPSRGAMWGAVIIAALVFAGGHLPATSLTVAITPLVVVRALVLNGVLGLLYGYLYWRRGLEAAMLSHFSSDVVLHFLLPLLG